MNIYNPKHSKRARRKVRHETQRTRNTITEPYVNTRHKAEPGKHNSPAVVTKPTPLNITAFQVQLHEQTKVTAHAFHAERSLRGCRGYDTWDGKKAVCKRDALRLQNLKQTA